MSRISITIWLAGCFLLAALSFLSHLSSFLPLWLNSAWSAFFLSQFLSKRIPPLLPDPVVTAFHRCRYDFTLLLFSSFLWTLTAITEPHLPQPLLSFGFEFSLKPSLAVLAASLTLHIGLSCFAHYALARIMARRHPERSERLRLKLDLLSRMLNHLLYSNPKLRSNPLLHQSSLHRYCRSTIKLSPLLNSPASICALSQVLFHGYAQHTNGILLIEQHMLKHCFPNNEERLALFDSLRMGNDDFVSECSLEKYCQNVAAEQLSLRPPPMDKVLQRIYSILSLISHTIILLTLISHSTLLTIAIIILACFLLSLDVSFGLARACSQYIINIYVYHFFEVGDLIRIDALDTPPAYVRRIGLFRITLQQVSGEIFTLKASSVYSSTIFNLQRVPSFSKTYTLQVAFNTLPSQLNALKDQINLFLSQNYQFFKPLFVLEIEQIPSLIALDITATIFYDFCAQEEGLRLQKEGEFLRALHAAITTCNILPPASLLPGYSNNRPLYISTKVGDL